MDRNISSINNIMDISNISKCSKMNSINDSQHLNSTGHGEKRWSIFVGSLPGHFTKKDIRLIFSRKYNVNIERVDMKTRDHPYSMMNCGYCTIQVNNCNIYHHILTIGRFEIYPGRYIICKPFMKGTKLKKATRNLDKRRIVLKQVPNYVDIEDIKRYFHKFSPIENIFPLNTEKQSANSFVKSLQTVFSKVQNTTTYSVVFNSVSDATNFFTHHPSEFITIFGHQINYQRFQYEIHTKTIGQTETREGLNTKSNIEIRQSMKNSGKAAKKEMLLVLLTSRTNKDIRYNNSNVRFNLLTSPPQSSTINHHRMVGRGGSRTYI